MEGKTKYMNDWKKRISDSQKSLSRKIEIIKKIGRKDKKGKNIKSNNRKSSFGAMEQKIDSKYKNILNKETFLVETKEGAVETRKPVVIYENLASLFLQARENTGLYIALSWPEGVEWPYLGQILANKKITRDCQYEDGLKVSFYPSSSRSMNRGRDIRIDKQELIREAREAAQNNRLRPRHDTYFALNDFEQDENDNIRQNPCVIQSTPFFALNDNFKWNVIGGGYFKDIHTYMFRVTGNKRRSVIEAVANELNNPVLTNEGVYLIDASVIPKNAADFSVKPIKTDILYVDGRSKILNSIRNENELIRPLIKQWIKNGHENSLIIFVDNPKIYKRTIYEALDCVRSSKIKSEKNLINRFSFFKFDNEITIADDKITEESKKIPSSVPDLIVVGMRGYTKLAKLYKIAKRMESHDEKLSHLMYRAIGYLDRLITMPISQTDLRDWIRALTESWSEVEHNIFAKKYLWKAYKREWLQLTVSSGAVASKDDFLKICDELVQIASGESEVAALLSAHLLEQKQRKVQHALVLVKEKRISEFVNEMLSDLWENDEDITIDVAVYSSEVNSSLYDDVYVLGFNDKDLKNILFEVPKGRIGTKIYISASSAFKIENELEIILDLDSFEVAHPYIQVIKNQISPILNSIRNLGAPSEFGIEKTYGNSYDYDYVYTSYANIYLSNSQVSEVGKDTVILKYAKNAFCAVTVEELEEGDWVLPLSGFVEDVEVSLGRSLPRENGDEDALKSYFREAQNILSSKFVSKTRKDMAKKVFTLMKEIDEKLSGEIHEGMVYRWIKHIEGFANDGGLSSNSAKKKTHFILFAKALGISDVLSNLFWENGVKAIRADHIRAGKGVSNTLKHILIKTINGNGLNLCEAEVERVISMAKQRICRVEMILLNENLDMER